MNKDAKRDLVDRLEHYIASQDKNPPRYYAGRKDILADIENACALSWELYSSCRPQLKAATRLIYGAPGAGKTSTLMHLFHRWGNKEHVTLAGDASARTTPVPKIAYFQGGPISMSPQYFLKEIIDQVKPGAGARLISPVSETRHSESSFGAWIARIGFSRTSQIQHRLPHAGLAKVAKLLSKEKWSAPVVIGIDEAQNMSGGKDSFLGGLLQELHDNNYELPLILVLGGLSDSRQQAGNMGLTRLSVDNVHSLDRFTAAEVQELKAGFCREFKLDVSSREAEFDRMLAACDGWPSHLTNALRSFCEVFIESGCAIGKVDFVSVEAKSVKRRNKYYAARMSNAMKYSCSLLADVMRQIDGEQHLGEVHRIIGKRAKAGESSEYLTDQLPDGMTSAQYYDNLTHHGALQERGSGIVECPIPSFRRYIIETYSNDAAETRRSTFKFDADSRHERSLPPERSAGTVH